MDNFLQAGTIGIYFYIGFCIVGVIIWAIFMYRLLPTKHKERSSNLMKVDCDKEEWHISHDVPCPGSLIVCEDSKYQLYFGYAVADNGRPALWHLPNYISDFRTPPATLAPKTLQRIPIVIFKRWQYIERRILPTETLRTYAEQYKEEQQ